MDVDLAISGFGVLTWLGEGPEGVASLLGEPVRPEPELLEKGLERPVGRIGRIRNHPFGRRYERFGQMDTFSRYGFIAAGHALDDARIPAPDPDFEEGGILFGTAFGCQEANQQFDQFSLDPAVGLRGASPLAFKGTVDNAPAGWAAVGYQLRGVNATFVSGGGAGAEAVLAGAYAIRDGRTRCVLAGGVERLIPLQLAALIRDGVAPRPYPSEGAALVVLEHPAAAGQREHRAVACLKAALRLPARAPSELADALRAAGCDPGSLDRISLAHGGRPDDGVLDGLADAAGLAGERGCEADVAGTLFAGDAPLALGLLVRRLARADGPRSGLVLARGEGDEVFALLAVTADD